MELNYTLLKQDYLTFNLFHTSKNPQVKRQRIRSWIIMAVCFVIISYFFYTNMGLELYISVPVFLIFLIVYPFRIASLYKNNITRSVDMNYGDAYPEQVFVTIGSDFIEIRDNRSLSRVNTPYIGGFIEIGDYFFIKLTSLNYIIIPKRNFPDLDSIRKKMLDISKMYDLPFEAELDWKWK